MQQPSGLQVVEARETLEKPVVVLAFALQVPGDKSIVPEGGIPEHGDPLALWWERPVPDPDWLGAVISTQVGDVARLLSRSAFCPHGDESAHCATGRLLGHRKSYGRARVPRRHKRRRGRRRWPHRPEAGSAGRRAQRAAPGHKRQASAVSGSPCKLRARGHHRRTRSRR